jgi:hypothetical protein
MITGSDLPVKRSQRRNASRASRDELTLKYGVRPFRNRQPSAASPPAISSAVIERISMPSSASQELKSKMPSPKTNLGSGIVSVRVMAEMLLPNSYCTTGGSYIQSRQPCLANRRKWFMNKGTFG